MHCYGNKLISLKRIKNLRNLRNIYYSHNPIEHMSRNIERILDREMTEQNIYEDFHNVYNHQI